MGKKFRIGLFTSAWDAVAWELVWMVHQAIQAGIIPNAEIAFLLCTRERGESQAGNLMIRNAQQAGLPLITFSSLHFNPGLLEEGRRARQRGDPSILEVWREEHDRAIAKLIPSTDLDMLLGYMWKFSSMMCQTRKIINLHPALPQGPKGTFREVIWELVKSQATETGVMIHFVTEILDRGNPVSFCRFPIRGGAFDSLWQEMEQRLKCESLDEIAKKEGEKNPLFELIRREGVEREPLMVVEAIRSVANGRIRIENGSILDSQGRVLTEGHDLTQEINAVITKNP